MFISTLAKHNFLFSRMFSARTFTIATTSVVFSGFTFIIAKLFFTLVSISKQISFHQNDKRMMLWNDWCSNINKLFYYISLAMLSILSGIRIIIGKNFIFFNTEKLILFYSQFMFFPAFLSSIVFFSVCFHTYKASASISTNLKTILTKLIQNLSFGCMFSLSNSALFSMVHSSFTFYTVNLLVPSIILLSIQFCLLFSLLFHIYPNLFYSHSTLSSLEPINSLANASSTNTLLYDSIVRVCKELSFPIDNIKIDSSNWMTANNPVVCDGGTFLLISKKFIEINQKNNQPVIIEAIYSEIKKTVGLKKKNRKDVNFDQSIEENDCNYMKIAAIAHRVLSLFVLGFSTWYGKVMICLISLLFIDALYGIFSDVVYPQIYDKQGISGTAGIDDILETGNYCVEESNGASESLLGNKDTCFGTSHCFDFNNDYLSELDVEIARLQSL